MKSYEDRYLKVLQDLRRAPMLARTPHFLSRLNFRKIYIADDLKDVTGARGLAEWRNGIVWLDARDLCRYMTPSPYSKPDGKSDMSPTGVLCHELGHFYWFAFGRKVPRAWMELVMQNPREKPITSYAKTHRGEDFAESFRLHLTNPAMLAALAPQRAQFLQDSFTETGVLRINASCNPDIFVAQYVEVQEAGAAARARQAGRV